mmetsp:Transcript_53300/g.125228  ORF Transcript_53300/g.125228 Transcript_53300/m.125228 type:complete len:214 (+) Transcript_53300:1909-2550(+)
MWSLGSPCPTQRRCGSGPGSPSGYSAWPCLSGWPWRSTSNSSVRPTWPSCRASFERRRMAGCRVLQGCRCRGEICARSSTNFITKPSWRHASAPPKRRWITSGRPSTRRRCHRGSSPDRPSHEARDSVFIAAVGRGPCAASAAGGRRLGQRAHDVGLLLRAVRGHRAGGRDLPAGEAAAAGRGRRVLSECRHRAAADARWHGGTRNPGGRFVR